jgi:hypothetical protein
MEYIAKVKEMQRSDPKAREQWGAYCEAQGGGVRDPAKHDATFIETFISNYSAGMIFELDQPSQGKGGSGTPSNLVDLFKEGQRKSASWKQAWALYCDIYGSGKHDPSKHETSFLIGFMDFLGQKGALALTMGGGGGMNPMAALMGMRGGMGMQGAPAAKMRKTDGATFQSTGDAVKDSLVNRIKSFQRSGPDEKQQWWDYCDQHLGGVRDPARHETTDLKYFASTYQIP